MEWLLIWLTIYLILVEISGCPHQPFHLNWERLKSNGAITAYLARLKTNPFTIRVLNFLGLVWVIQLKLNWYCCWIHGVRSPFEHGWCRPNILQSKSNGKKTQIATGFLLFFSSCISTGPQTRIYLGDSVDRWKMSGCLQIRFPAEISKWILNTPWNLLKLIIYF